MNTNRLTLQNTLALTILVIGIIGIALVFFTDYTYRQLAYEQQQDSIGQLIGVKSADLIEQLTTRQKDLGFRLQSEPGFKEALIDNNHKEVTYWIDQEFNRYYVTIGLIKLEKIIVYDKNFQLVASSDRGIGILNNEDLPCAQLIQQVRSLPSIQHSKPHSKLCRYNNRTLSSTVVSVGSLKPKGYVQIIANPAFALTEIENELGLPLKIFDNKNNLLHQSVNWPAYKNLQDNLISTYSIPDDNKKLFIKIQSASEITAFRNHLNDTRYNVIMGASVLTLLTILIALAILQRGLLPLKKLRDAANSSAKGEFISVDEKVTCAVD